MSTILIVEDYAPNHRLMSFVLEQQGYAVVAAFNGQQGLDQMQNTPIDLVLTDLTMPKLDGLGLARAIRENSQYADTPIIVVTGNTHEQDHVRASGIGVDALLTKPVDSEDLIDLVNRLLQQKKGGGAPPLMIPERSAA
jgi:two-component system chemotaxis response regulator CheY